MIAPVTPGLRPKANVYVDGFNLYNGCFNDHTDGRVGWRRYRWLDLGNMCSKRFPEFDINRIRYFTALVKPSVTNPDCQVRQQTYIRALETIPNLTVHRGSFSTWVKSRLIADPNAKPPAPLLPEQVVSVIQNEEKGSDVNLASYMLLDAFKQEYDWAIVISNDSDLATPIKLVIDELGKYVLLVNPRNKVAAGLQGIASDDTRIREGTLRDSQFPDTLTDAVGTITKPVRWT